jgi:hypothetical protein
MIFAGIGEQNNAPSEGNLLRGAMAIDQGVKVGSF